MCIRDRLQAMSEYRISCYQYDREYREHVKQWRSEHNGNCLCHYTVIEEAHRILQVPSNANYDANPQALAAEKFCEMLSEIREPGEGLMIIDQYPSRLIPDAIKNTNFKLVHRLLAADDRNAMASCMALTNSQSQLLSMLKKDVYKRQTSALEQSQNSQRLSWSFEEVDAKLKDIMVNIFAKSADAAKRYGVDGNYVAGANIAGFEMCIRDSYITV